MTNQDIKDLIAIFHESGISEMEVQRGDNRLKLRRGGVQREMLFPSPQALASMPPPTPAARAGTGSSAAAAAAPAREADANHMLVKSPIVGTYYDQSSPGAPPFVKVGDSVEAGSVLCIIESMKLMNEIEAETSGIIAAKLCENGHPVEYGEALFAIRPR